MILNTFPDLLTFSLVSPFILRIALGIIVINLGFLKLHIEKKAWEKLFETINLHPAKFLVKVLALFEIIGGIMLLVGSYTQLIAILFSILFFCKTILEYKEPTLEKRNLTFYILVFVISLSLIFSGAGAFAFDLPL